VNSVELISGFGIMVSSFLAVLNLQVQKQESVSHSESLPTLTTI